MPRRVISAEKPLEESHAVGVQVIARAADVLRALRDEPDGLSLSQLAKAVSLPRSTVHRLVRALEVEQFVAAASPYGRVRLGSGLAVLAVAAAGELRDRLRPHLEALYEAADETVDLAVLDGDQVRFIDQIPAAHRLRAVSAIGLRFPLHCTANGKALLAALPRERAVRVLPTRLRSYTDATVTSRPDLWRMLDEIKETHIAYDREEHTVGISAVGTCVQDPLGQMAAITIVVPSLRFHHSEQRLAAHLLEARRAVQQELDAEL